jgi:hypothetical protein
MKFFHGARATLLAAAATGACAFGHAAMPTTSTPLGHLKTYFAVKCVAVAADAVAPGVQALQRPCDEGATSQMRFASKGNGYFEIRVGSSDMCLGVSQASHASNALVVQEHCGGTHTEWRPTRPLTYASFAERDRPFKLQARHSGLCLDLQYGNRGDNVPLLQFSCDEPGAAQYFSFREDATLAPPPAPVSIASVLTGQCISAENANAQTPEWVTAQACDAQTAQGGRKQQWRLKPHGGRADVVQIVSTDNGSCLDVMHGSTSAGAPVLQHRCHGELNQLWVLIGHGAIHQLKSVASGKCLVPALGNMDQAGAQWGTRLIQIECTDDATNQNALWSVRSGATSVN